MQLFTDGKQDYNKREQFPSSQYILVVHGLKWSFGDPSEANQDKDKDEDKHRNKLQHL